MPWVRIDDHFDEHPKIAGMSDSAFALFVSGLAYCNRNLTDGFIPNMVGISKLRYCDGNAIPAVRELEDSGLWVKVQGGWEVHDYLDYQPTKESVMHEREASKRRMQESRARRRVETEETVAAHVAPQHAPMLQESCSAPVPDPVPVSESRIPNPKPTSKAIRSADASRGSRLADPFEPPDEWLEFARRERPPFDPEIEAQKFADYWHGVPGAKGRKTDWAGTWRNFVRSDFYGKGQNNGRKPPGGHTLQSMKAEITQQLRDQGITHGE